MAEWDPQVGHLLIRCYTSDSSCYLSTQKIYKLFYKYYLLYNTWRTKKTWTWKIISIPEIKIIIAGFFVLFSLFCFVPQIHKLQWDQRQPLDNRQYTSSTSAQVAGRSAFPQYRLLVKNHTVIYIYQQPMWAIAHNNETNWGRLKQAAPGYFNQPEPA